MTTFQAGSSNCSTGSGVGLGWAGGALPRQSQILVGPVPSNILACPTVVTNKLVRRNYFFHYLNIRIYLLTLSPYNLYWDVGNIFK